MNLATCDWDDDLCRLFGVPRDALPAIVPTTSNFGAISCGAAKVPLTASVVDQQASLYGHGCRSAGDTKITFGTGAFALTVTGGLKRMEAQGPLATIAWRKAGENPVYALDGGVYCAGSAVNWARDLGLFERFEDIDAFDRPPAIGRNLAFVPALAGLACPHWDRAARGAWLGLSLDTTRADMMQAVLEGVALRIGEVVAAIEVGQPITDPLSIDGGMTANPYFCRFLADALGRNLVVSDHPELTAIGTAALAAEAVGQQFPLQRRGRLIESRPLPAGNRQTFAAARAAIEAFGAAMRI
jgi:glycerol kinase